MTSEIALWNKNSVALAADSASTWNSRDIFNTSEKIFQLAGRQPVGYMVYGSGAYMGVSWSRVFGAYRQFLGAQIGGNGPKSRHPKELRKIQSHSEEYWGEEEKNVRHGKHQKWSPKPPEEGDWNWGEEKEDWDWDSLGYVEHFLHFLSISDFALEHLSDNEGSDSTRAMELHQLLYREVTMLKMVPAYSTDDWLVRDDISLKKSVSGYNRRLVGMLREELSSKAEHLYEQLSEEEKRRHRNLLQTETKILNEVVESVRFQLEPKIKITREMRTWIRKLACVFLTTGRRDARYGISGIVIAGFGEEEAEPTVVHLRTHSKWRGQMEVFRINDGKALEQDKHSSNAETFAQSGMVDTLLGGRHSGWDEAVEMTTRRLVGQFIYNVAQRTKGISEDGKLTKNMIATAEGWESRSFTHAITEQAQDLFRSNDFQRWEESFIPNHLYKLAPSDLASLAEQLIQTEVTFQYVIRSQRGVGGAVDVASITKENGFMWVNRKDTFDPALNPRTHHNIRESAEHI